MTTLRRGEAAALSAALTVLVLVAGCGQSSRVADRTSPSAGPASASSSPGTTPGSTPTAAKASPSPSPSASTAATRLVIADYVKNQVRLARLDAVDTAAVTGAFDGVVNDQVIILNGKSLLALAPSGAVRTLGHLAGVPEGVGVGTVVVKPSLDQWLYTLTDLNLTSSIHLGGPGGDRQVASIPSPDGGSYFQPYAWNASGVYVVQEQTGLGGVGPILEYHFPLGTIDLSSGRITMVSPKCVAEDVLDDGTFLCMTLTGGLEVRPPSGQSHMIPVGNNSVYGRLTLSPDAQHFVATRNANTNPEVFNYQTVAGGIAGSAVSVFGPADFYPDAWLPDGRLVANHLCWTFQGNGGPCNAALDGTYFVSADGKSTTFFFKLAEAVAVVAAV